MSFTDRYITQIKRLWLFRDLYLTLKNPYVYRQPTPGLTDELLLQVAQGTISIALYPCAEDGCAFLAYDLDTNKPEQTDEVNQALAFSLLQQLGAGTLVEKSGASSYHVTKFFAPHKPVEQVVALAQQTHRPRWYTPHGRTDKYPSTCTCMRLPGVNPKDNFKSQLWDGSKWLDFGTDEFAAALEAIVPDADPQLPEAETWPVVIVANQGAKIAAGKHAYASGCLKWKTIKGAKLWARIHKTSLQTPGDQYKQLVASILNKKEIECSECLSHAKEYIAAHPVPDDPALHFQHGYNWHAAVNAVAKKANISEAEARQLWGG